MLNFYWLDFTTKDHPWFYSLILYTNWCNLRCYWCHNRRLAWWDYNQKKVVTINTEEFHPKLSEEELRMAIQNEFIDMVILCWWEFLIYSLQEIEETITWIKSLNPNVLIRIDTNWTFPEKVKYVKEKKLADWFAIDIKWPYWNSKYWSTISNVIWLPQKASELLFPKMLESINIADTMEYTLFRTVQYPIVNEEYFNEIKQYTTNKLKSPHSFNLFVEL